MADSAHSTDFPAPGTAHNDMRTRSAAATASRGVLAFWQFGIAALVVLMILVGGLTRLTDSGLSITEWNLVTGVLEWGHRFLGRFLGVAYLIPFLLFWLRGRIPTGWVLALFVPGLLIAVQGAIGWWMVASGLTERVDVAPYRLATHLGVAFLIFGLLIWNGFKLLREGSAPSRSTVGAISAWVIALTSVQILSGALVAGLDAGRGYIDWPSMNGYFLPPEATELSPFWVNIFENPALAQFDHRMLAYALVLAVGVLWWRSRRSAIPSVRRYGSWVLIAALGQSLWGILTLINAAPWHLAILHQFGAVILLFLLLRLRFEARYPKRETGTA